MEKFLASILGKTQTYEVIGSICSILVKKTFSLNL